MRKITTVCITGGQCSGKSTSMSFLRQQLEKRGFQVLTVAETATELIKQGYNPPKLNYLQQIQFQKALLKLQLVKEQEAIEMARTFNKPTVVLFDRGVYDGAAFVSKEDWSYLSKDLDPYYISKTYDAVIHLVTAADSAERFYNTENNIVRYGTPEQARTEDKALQEIYSWHMYHKVIDNNQCFENKMFNTLKYVLEITGYKDNTEIERKYLVSSIPNVFNDWDQTEYIEIEQIYIKQQFGENLRIRKEKFYGIPGIANGQLIYTSTLKVGQGLTRREESNTITEQQYEELTQLKDPTCVTIRKTRFFERYRNQLFEIDVFKDIPLILMEREMLDEHQPTELPPNINVVREVTNEAEFTNRAIAQRIHEDTINSNPVLQEGH